MTWKTAPWTIVDLETTSAEEDCKIVEIGIVKMQHGKVLDYWSTYVNPEIPIPYESTMIHGITDEIATRFPPWREVQERVANDLQSAEIVVGYNIFGFDEDRLRRHGVTWTAPTIDPFAIVRSNHAITMEVGPGLEWKSEPWKGRDPLEMPDAPKETRKLPSKFSLAGVAHRLNLIAPEPGVPPELHTAVWDCVLAGRILHAALHLCSSDATQCSIRLRNAHMIAQNKAKALRKWMYEKELKAHDEAKARFHAMILERDRRIAELAIERHVKGEKIPW
jgi:DNA polymerase III epsilon subunit-like protein